MLLTSLLGMRFSDHVDWGLGDFVLAALLLIGGNLLYETLSRNCGTTHRLLVSQP